MCHWAKYFFDSLPKADWIKINQPTKQSSSQSITDSPDLNVNVQITSVQKVSFFQSNLSTTKTTELSKDIKGNIVDLHEAGMITRKVVDQHKTSQFINDLKAKSSFGISSIHCFRGRETQCTVCCFLSLLCPFGYPLVCLYLDVQHPMSCIMSLGFPGNTLYRCSCILALITVFHVCPAWQPFAPCCYVLDCFRGIFAQHASGTFLVWKTPASIDFVLRVYSCGVIISASVLSFSPALLRHW